MRRSSRTVVLCLAMAVVLTAPIIGPARAGTMQTYIVLYNAQAVPADAARTITNAGGVFVYAYDAIGVGMSRSDSPLFRDPLLADSRIENVSSTAGFATRLRDVVTTDASAPSQIVPGPPVTDNDSLSPLQWDMVQIHTPEAHAITGGSRDVLVGDIDTGLDYTHPDLAPNVDSANSVNCITGAPVPGKVAAKDDNGHGTHTAGTIAAAANGLGIVGVAPNVRIAGIKAGNSDGFFFPEAVVCAFMWAGSHHIDVTNNSYFADPWLFNCKNDPEQKAIFSAEQRAIKYAQQHGTVVVAASGNASDDLAHSTQDRTSPDNTTPIVRDITNACAVVPVEVPGVVGVNANGSLGYKSYYSNYGVGTSDVTAPGGDRRYQITSDPGGGRILSTWPAAVGCVIPLVDPSGATYCYIQGTSMASPHVAGVSALIRSQHPGWSSGAIAATIGSTADPIPCPASMTSPVRYDLFPAFDNKAPQVCTGGTGYNSFYGHGQVNALSAVSK